MLSGESIRLYSPIQRRHASVHEMPPELVDATDLDRLEMRGLLPRLVRRLLGNLQPSKGSAAACRHVGVIHRWYIGVVATSHPRIQVTEDPELARALRAAAPHLPAGLSRSRQVRELAIAGARHIADEPPSEERRTMLLEGLAESFMKPETAGIDWDLLRDGKLRAWPIR
jgi:hypothetical protein